MIRNTLAIVLVLAASPAFAQMEELEARMKAGTCSSCFTVALVTLKQLPGVTEVTGDAREGWIKISVDPKRGVSIKDAMDRVRVAGFTENPEYTIKAEGKLERRGNRIILVVPHQKELFIVEPGQREQMAMNAASSKSKVRATGVLKGGKTQFNLKISALQNQ